MRAIVLSLLLLGFVFLASRDELMHWRLRKPPTLEKLLHLVIAGFLVATFIAAFRNDAALLFYGVLGVLGFGGVDEFIFHRGIPADEHSIHAKQHLSLLAFIAAAFLLP